MENKEASEGKTLYIQTIGGKELTIKILHAILEFPLFSTGGGLTRYAVNLMEEQIHMSLSVCALYAGHFDWLKKLRIKRVTYHNRLEVYKIINPLPIAIPFCIREPKKYMYGSDKDVYMRFLSNIKPDIIHAHTIMGIHKEFFEAAKELDIPVMYTSHDYFGLCARTNFINQNGLLCKNIDVHSCVECNANAGVPSYVSKILQSEMYTRLKNTWLLKRIRNYGRKKLLDSTEMRNTGSLVADSSKCQEYEDLYAYYRTIFNTVDTFHFNSTVSQEVYRKYLGNIKGKVISITHAGISDHRIETPKSLHMPVRIGYIGSTLPCKGVNLLLDVMNALQDRRAFQWELHLYGDDFSGKTVNFQGKVFSYGKYSNSQLSSIMKMVDIVIVPSIGYETFGFVVLEALSYGIPVLVSASVGAKDLIKDAPSDVVFEPNKESLLSVLTSIVTEKGKYNAYSSWISKQEFPLKLSKHTEVMLDYYKEILYMKTKI